MGQVFTLNEHYDCFGDHQRLLSIHSTYGQAFKAFIEMNEKNDKENILCNIVAVDRFLTIGANVFSINPMNVD